MSPTPPPSFPLSCRSWLIPDFAGSFPFDTVIAAILEMQGNLHSTNFFRFLKCERQTERGAGVLGDKKTVGGLAVRL